MRRLWPLLLLLAACEEPVELPFVLDRTAVCDDDAWTLTATADHPSGPSALDRMEVDVGLLFYDEIADDVDLQYIQTLVLDPAEAPGSWESVLPTGTTALECGFDGEYQLVFVVIDTAGNQGVLGLRVDAQEARID